MCTAGSDGIIARSGGGGVESGSSDGTDGRSEKTECVSLSNLCHHSLIDVSSLAKIIDANFLKIYAAHPMPLWLK